MIGALLRVGAINLRRDRVAQVMTFVLPVAFFSVFAAVFGQQRRETPPVRLAVVDDDGSEASRRLVEALAHETALRVVATGRARAGVVPPPLDREAAGAMVRAGNAAAALIVPRGFGETFGQMPPAGTAPVELLTDPSDPVAGPVVNGLVQKAAMTSAPDLLVRRGMAQFERYAGALTPGQRAAVDQWLPTLGEGQPAADRAAVGEGGAALAGGVVPVTVTKVLGAHDDSLVSFWAAGLGVMFLLFSLSNSSGSLLDESDSGTLERVLSSRVGMGRLLLGKWLYMVLLGTAQVTVMFTWGAVVFHVPLASHLAGFAVVTVMTAAAAAAFALVLATAARTRAQLGGISSFVIMIMSAVGGSMFPRFLMSETMQRIGLLTFNAWALDAYVKVFWRQAPLSALWPQLAFLGVATAVFFGIARVLARRWETA